MIARPTHAMLLAVILNSAAVAENDPSGRSPAISYHEQIRPIFQANCQGCHQPAKASGEYLMTRFDRLLAGGESELAAIAPGDPDASYLVDLITPVNGQAEMPQGREPLSAREIAMIRQWVTEGAADDSPRDAVPLYDAEHPPRYSRLPVITSLDFSPDGQWLAVSGFHEVLLHRADGGRLVARLIGLSERIESVSFSPDGQRLAVTGGLPGRMGEVQIWNVASRSLELSVPVGFDTLYGGSWSPDGKLVAFGCPDNSVRAIDAETGEQVLYQGAHDDWVRDTVFSTGGGHLVSVGRDMTAKLTEVQSERFVDNVTSITPGALAGGLTSVARHPERDEVVIGGADGAPKVYRIFRQTSRVIGDDANLIRRLPTVGGRVFDVAVSPNGKRIAVVSSLNGRGELHVFGYAFDTSLSDELKRILGKRVAQWNAEERKLVENYLTAGVEEISAVRFPETAMYAVAFSPDSQIVAAAGADGTVRLIATEDGALRKRFTAVPVNGVEPPEQLAVRADTPPAARAPLEPESPPANARLAALEILPAEIELEGPYAYAQLLITGRLDNGQVIDVTRIARVQDEQSLVEISDTGRVQARNDGDGRLGISLGGVVASVPVHVRGTAGPYRADFVQDVAPVLSRLGCNQGTCHGAAKGKNGFKLSLRGYDAVLDVRALTDDLASRRVTAASPDDSLMLLKASGRVPHMGGQLTQASDSYYAIIRNWIASGATLDLSSPRVASIELQPQNPTVQSIGQRQQVRVVATYSDGTRRDVTREAFIQSGNTEVVTAAAGGLMTAVRRGESPILARYEGAYAATTLTVMGNRDGFVWVEPPCNNEIDRLVAAKLRRMKILPSEICGDSDFLRRVYLDLTGLPPTADQVREFLADHRDPQTKRNEVIDRLIGSDDFIEHWTNRWADLLQVNRKFLGAEGAAAFRQWIRQQVAENTPYDEFVRQLLTAQGSNKENPPASYFKILRTPEATMENTTHLFLGVRFNCNKCHDHPFERWTQDQYYQTAAWFARVGLKADPASGNKKLGGTAVEGAKPLYEIVFEKSEGEVLHDRTKAVSPPAFPYPAEFDAPVDATRRQRLAAWLTAGGNRYFARSYVNRLWGYLFGVGIIEPIDDIRAGNPPTNPELLDYLTKQFLDSGFDMRHVLRRICQSRTYQLSIATNRWNEDDLVNDSHARARRLPAEVLYDTIMRATGSVSHIPGVPAGTRAAALPDSGIKLPDGFLSTFGRPPRDSACECDRSSEMQLGPVMALISGPTVADAIADPNNALAQLVQNEPDDNRWIDEMFMRFLNRPATEAELQSVRGAMEAIEADHRSLQAAVREREQYVAEQQDRLEQQRQQRIERAEAELIAYEKELAPRLAQQEKEKAAEADRLQKELAAYETELETRLAEWQRQQKNAGSPWEVLAPSSLETTTGATLETLPDRSVLVTGDNGQGEYRFTAEIDLRTITAIRLEALADERLPGKGPGRAPNGNFVLSEFEVHVAPKSDPAAARRLALKQALADFSQDNYGVASSVDGQSPDTNNGWAVSPNTGITHWATFQFAGNAELDEPAVLTFKLVHKYRDGQHSLGRFRLSVTSAPHPVGLSVPGSIEQILALDKDKRTDKQQDALIDFFRERDPELNKKMAAVIENAKPLPTDPRRKQLRDSLAYARRPVAEDPVLAALKHDLELSAEQLKHKRLIAAQDLAWALINSPAFLFNH